MKARKITRWIGLFLSVLMLVTMLGVFSMTASAADAVSYVENAWNETTETVDTDTTRSVAEYTAVTSSSDAVTWSTGWYVVSDDAEISKRITVSGDVHLILCDNATLTATLGIGVPEGSTLTVYSQSSGDSQGKLVAQSDSYSAAIGGTYESAGEQTAGKIYIQGGIIEASCVDVSQGAAIGSAGTNGNYRSPGATVWITGGKITATAFNYGAGIGGGMRSHAGTILIANATVHATGGANSTGIGNGEYGSAGSVSIYSGNVTAIGGGGSGGVGLGGGGVMVSIHGGVVTATAGGTSGNAGIGAPYGRDAGTILITGGTVTATASGERAAGIGGGAGYDVGHYGGTIVITGGNVTATGGNGAPGIGSGAQSYGSVPEDAYSSITILGGTVNAIPGEGASAIGASKNSKPSTMMLLDSATNTVTVSGDHTFVGEYTLPEGTTLVVPEGASLTLDENATFINNGTLQIAGTLINNSSSSDCGANASHIYSADCDVECDLCRSETRTTDVSHTYFTDCDAICDSCGAQRDSVTAEHVYVLTHDETHHWKVCACGEIDPANPKTEHTFSDTWQTSETHHWKACSCEARGEETEHQFSWQVDGDTAWRVCSCEIKKDPRALSYSITFYGNGAEGDMSAEAVGYTDNYEFMLPANAFTAPADKIFAGWSVAIGEAAAVIMQPDDTITATDDVTVTAIWEEEYSFVTPPAAIPELVYSGETLVLITEGTGNSAAQERGTVKYRLGDGEWSEALPVAIDAGIYTVHYGIFEGENGPYAYGSLTVTVDAKPITPVIENLGELDYVPGLGEENPSKPSITLSVDGEIIDPVNYTVSYANNTANGTAIVTVTANADGNYSFEPVSKEYQVTDHMHQWEYSVDETDGNVGYATCISTDGGACVEGRVVTLTLTAPASLTYDGLAKEATLESSLPFEQSFVIVYTDQDGSMLDAPTDAGKYRALVAFGEALDIYVEFEILPLSLTLEWMNTDLTYNGEEQKPTVSVLTGLPITAENVVVTVNGAEKNVGSYTATATLDSDNYTLTNATEEFSIAPMPLTLEWYDLRFVYDSEEHLPTVGIVGGVVPGDTVNVAVSLDQLGWAISAGNYQAIATVDNPNYTLTNARQEFTIEPRELESPVIGSVTYNGELQIASLPLSDDYIVTVNDGGIDAGEYDVVLTLTNLGNTKWKNSDTDTLTLKFVIEKRVLDLSGYAEFQTVYTGEAQAPQILIGAPYECIGVETFTNVGEYEVVLQLIDTANYEWKNPDSEDATLTTAIFTIDKAPNEWVEAPAVDDWHMNETPSEPVYQALFGNGGVRVVYYPANGSIEDATEEVPIHPGEYVAQFTVAGTVNYAELIGMAEFQILDPYVMIGSWALPVFHYMDTNGIISETRPEGGYAYLREDGVLVLNHFELDASVLATIERTEENGHLYARDFDPTEVDDVLIKLAADTTVLLIGENRLVNFASSAAIGSAEASLTLRGELLAADGAIIANGLALESCAVFVTDLVSMAFLRASSCLLELGSNITVLGDLTLTDCTVICADIIVRRNITVEGSVVIGESMMTASADDVFCEMTVRNSHIELTGPDGLQVVSLVAEDSVFEITASEFEAIRAEILNMKNCELKLSALFGVFFRYAELTDCTVEPFCENGLFNQATDDTSSTLVLNNCEIEAETEGVFTTMIRATEVVVNGGKLKLTGGDFSCVILCDTFWATDAELALKYGEMALKANEIEIRRTKLTIEQAETATTFGSAIEAMAVFFYDSTISIKGGMKGIQALSYLDLTNSTLDIELAVNEGATASPVTEGDATENTEPVAPVYMGIQTYYFYFYGADSALTVTIPEDAEGRTIQVQTCDYEEDTMQITAPEGASWQEIPTEEEGAIVFSEIVVIDGETVTYPKSVTISYVEPEEDLEEPKAPVLYVGGVVMENGKYLDNNGKISDEKPEGGYAHLLDGVLTLHDFTYYGVGYLFYSEYNEELDYTYEYYAGVYSTYALTLRLEGENLLDLSTFAGDRETYGVAMEEDLTVEGNGVLKVFATNDGIEVLGALTVSGCTVEMDTGSEGFDVYGTALFENCKLVLNVVDDAIWTDDDLTMVDCTVEIVSEDSDGIYADADVTLIDSTFHITAYSDGIDAEDDLIMIGCEAVIEAHDVGIEVDNDVEITECVLHIMSDDHGIESDDESIVITESTLVINSAENGIYVEDGNLSLIGSTLTVTADDNAIQVSAKLTVEDSTLTLTAFEIGIANNDSNAMLLSMSGANNLFDREIIIRNSTVAVNDSYVGIIGFRMTAMDSTLQVSSDIVAVDAGILLLENCEGTLSGNEYVSIVAGDLKVIGCDLKLSGSGVIEAEMVRLSDSKLRLYKWGDPVSPVIECGALSIEGENTEIFCNMGDRFAVYEDINVDSNLIFCDPYENWTFYFDPVDGCVYEYEGGDTVGEFLIVLPTDDVSVEEEKVLVIGDKELGVGEYLDSEGNVTSEIPAGGFAYFNGSELILKNFTLEGGGTTLITLNGEELTAGIYNPGALTVRLIGSNRLKFTSAATVGIALGDGDLTLLGDGSLTLDTTATGIALFGGLAVDGISLTVKAAGTGVKANNARIQNATVTVEVSGDESVYGIWMYGGLDVIGSTLDVTAEGTVPDTETDIEAYALYCEIGGVSFLDCTVTVSTSGVAIMAGSIELAEDLAILIPANGKIASVDGGYSILDSTELMAKQVTVGASPKVTVEAETVTVGGVELSDGEYLDNDGNITTEKPESGYAYLKDGVLTLNNFVYLTKKYDSHEGIYATGDLTLVLIGENKIDSYNKNGICVEGDLTVNGGGTLNLVSGEVCVKADGVTFLGGEVTLTSEKGEHVLVASDSITLGELLVASSPVGAVVQKLDGRYLFTDTKGNGVSALTLTWVSHDCIDEDAVDHLCDVCGKDYPTCKDANLDHACDACGGEMGYHADTNSDHVCEYGCGVAIGECKDADTDHDCDYGCAKVYGECKDADLDHDCDYGCDKVFGNCADGDRDHDCDYGCDKVFGTCADADTDHDCDYGCSKAYGEHTDAGKDHTCDYGCSVKIGDHVDLDHDHVCDYGCAVKIGACTDADHDHECDYGCDEPIEEHVAASGSHICAYCNDDASDCVDADGNHICDVCGDELPHSYSDTWSSDNHLHWHACTCGAKKDVAIHVPGAAATATTAQTCTVCGHVIQAATGHTTHTPADTWMSDETHHWHKCTGCTSELLDKAEHDYDNDCDVDCNTCGKTRVITHSYKTEWSKNESLHWHECSVCGNKKDEDGHTPGAAATATTAQTCTVCGYVITPATEHTTHTPAASWTSDATHHWHECTGCATELLDKAEHEYDNDCDIDCNVCGKIRTVSHDYKTELSKDATGHWNECAECGNKIQKADHTFGAWTVTKEATATEKGSKTRSCACGFAVEEEIPALGSGEEETTDVGNDPDSTPSDDEDGGLPAGAIVAIVLGSTVVAGAGGFALWWFVISKRTLVQLGEGCRSVAGKVGGACKSAAQKVKSIFTKKS